MRFQISYCFVHCLCNILVLRGVKRHDEKRKRIGIPTPQNGAEYGSQSQDCWKYVMRCATFVLSIGGGGSGGTVKKKTQRSVSKSPRPAAARPKDDVDDLDLNFSTGDGEEETL